MKILLQRFPDLANELISYMTIIRGASVPFENVYKYDKQFLLRKARDHMRVRDVIDGQLWLQFIAVGINHVQQTSSTSHTVNKPCYDYNFKGVCTRMNCIYSHSCIRCSQFHPLMYCTNYSYNKSNPRSSVTSHYSAPVSKLP